MMESSSLAAARTFVAAMFQSLRRSNLAVLVAAGEGDDFPEVGVAVALLSDQADQLMRQSQALQQYADQSFWDDETPGGSLASHDKGQMARNVLAGKAAFFHRD